MWEYYNPNPMQRSVGDCAVRAVSKALNIDWDTAFDLIAHNAKMMGDMPSSNSVWGSVLRQHGFERRAIPDYCPDCYTAAEFCRDHPRGIYVLGFGSHTATAINGTLFDAWNSSGESPQYFWYRRK